MKHMTSFYMVCCYIAAAVTISACEKPLIGEDVAEIAEPDVQGEVKTKKFTFTTKGEFQMESYQAAKRAPAYLTAPDNTMTDLWVFDYVDGVLQQQLHQTATDSDWGQPTMNLTYATHHIYFVASRGAEPIVDTDGHVITFETPRDTYWKDYEVTVVSTSNGNRAVTLDRVVTKLSLSITDYIPEDIATVTITPEHRYYGLNYTTGEAVEDSSQPVPITVPDSKKGNASGLTISMFSFSPAAEWVSDINVTAETATGSLLGSATITDAPFQRNRVTNYSGSLFSQSGQFQLSVNADWDEPYAGTW